MNLKSDFPEKIKNAQFNMADIYLKNVLISMKNI